MPKHVKSYFKYKFEKSVHLVGFIIRIHHDAQSPERQNHKSPLISVSNEMCSHRHCSSD